MSVVKGKIWGYNPKTMSCLEERKDKNNNE